jgi:hypothetical protein
VILASSFRNTAKMSTLVAIRGIELYLPRKLKILAVHNSTDYCDCVPTQSELTSGCEKYEKQNTREGSIDVAAVVRLNQGRWHHTVSGRPCGREETPFPQAAMAIHDRRSPPTETAPDHAVHRTSQGTRHKAEQYINIPEVTLHATHAHAAPTLPK